MEEQAEGLVGIAVFQPLEGDVRGDVRGIAGTDDSFPVADEHGIVIVALAGEDVPVVEPRRVAHQVPFPDHRRLVPPGLQEFREGLLAAVEVAVLVVREPVGMAVLAGQQAGPGRTAQGVGDEAVREPGPFVGQPVDMGRPHVPLVIGADGLVRMVVAHDVHDVQRLLWFRLFL